MQQSTKLVWALVCTALGGLPACGYGNDRPINPVVEDCGELRQGTIDPGGHLEVPAGSGAGVLVEYDTGGHWRVRTLCDTNRTGDACPWDILLTPRGGAVISKFTPEDLEQDDYLGWDRQSGLRFVTNTRSDFDTAQFDATPGGTIRIDALLGGWCAHPYIFWVTDHSVHPGAPSNPIDMTPSAP